MTRYAVERGRPESVPGSMRRRTRARGRGRLGVTVLLAVALLLGFVLPVASTSAKAQTTTFLDAPVADADTSESSPDLNVGDFDEVHMGDQGGLDDLHTLIRWDLSGIPAGSTVLNATIRVYAFDHGEGDVDTEFYLLMEAWGELTVTRNTEPSRASTPDYIYAQNTSESGTGWNSYNVTTLAQSWVDGPNYGFVALNDTEDEIISWATREDEFSRFPELTIIWEGPPPVDFFALGAALMVVITAMAFFAVVTKKERKFEDLVVVLILVAVLLIALGAWLASR